MSSSHPPIAARYRLTIAAITPSNSASLLAVSNAAEAAFTPVGSRLVLVKCDPLTHPPPERQ
jgi:hypothetical protein